jgi:hypothetical protein
MRLKVKELKDGRNDQRKNNGRPSFQPSCFVFIGTASQISGSAVELGLQFRAEMHFRDLSVAPRPLYWLRNEDSNL